MKTFFYVALFLVIAGAFAVLPPTQIESSAQINNDINVLNFALTLENLEAVFYTMGQNIFTQQNFVDAGYAASVYQYLNLIRDHENTHVSFLRSVIQGLGATPVPACTYRFNELGYYTNVSTYLAAAMVLENTGVMAYDGAANAITNAQYLTAAATIATTEARHAAFLNELNRVFAFNNASFDTPLNASTIYAMVQPLIASCPSPQLTQFPQVRSNFVYNYTYSESNEKRDFSKMEKLNSRRVYETPAAVANDNAVLNYALHLEQFGAAFYTAAQQKFSLTDFINAGFNESVYTHFQLIVLHEQVHPAFLRSVLVARNASLIVDPCTYNLDDALASVNSVLMTARMVENLEVTAYDGGINAITDEGIVQAAATIATIEARHAAYLNYLLLGQGVQPSAFDATHTPLEILNITAPFFATCPQQVPVPMAPYSLFATNLAAPGTCVHPEATRMRALSWLDEVKCDHSVANDTQFTTDPFIREFSVAQNLAACPTSDSTLGDCSGTILFYHTCKPMIGRGTARCNRQRDYLAASVTFTCDLTKMPVIACNLPGPTPSPACPSPSNRPTHFF